MKAAVLHKPRDLRIEDIPLETEQLKPDEVWVETQLTAFKIGTDRGNYAGADRVPGTPGYPRCVGDSNLGIVRGVGNAVERFQVGDRVVAVMPHQSAYVTRQTARIVKVPEGVHSEDAVFAFLYTLSGHCYRKAFFQPGENVGIVGLGLLGLGAVAYGRCIGARVFGIANSEIRIQMAKRGGIHEAALWNDPDLKGKIDAFTNGIGLDLVILAANPWSAYHTALSIVRPNGRVSIVSLLGRGEEPVDFDPLARDMFYVKGISLIAVSGPPGNPFPTSGVVHEGPYPYPAATLDDRFSENRACQYTLSLMAEGQLEPKHLITHRFHYTEMVEAYEMAVRREKSMLGVVFDWKNREDR